MIPASSSPGPYRAILWDLDGTLTDPKEGITKCMQHTLRRLHIEPPSCAELEWIIGPPLHSSLHKLLDGDAELVAEGVNIYRERFASIGLYENTVYEGIPEVLRDLQEDRIVNIVATFKPEPYARTILEHFGLDGYFAAVFGNSFDSRNVDKKDLVKLAIQSVQRCSPSEIVMVGDRRQDVEGARSNGIDSVGVLYGYGSRSELEEAGATIIVENVETLRVALFSNTGGRKP